MNIKDYIKKVFENAYFYSYEDQDDAIKISVEILKEVLQDNIDLIAKEMHMEVERQATLKRQPKYDRIEVPVQNMFKICKNCRCENTANYFVCRSCGCALDDGKC